jgi:hypothetical protein
MNYDGQQTAAVVADPRLRETVETQPIKLLVNCVAFAQPNGHCAGLSLKV